MSRISLTCILVLIVSPEWSMTGRLEGFLLGLSVWAQTRIGTIRA
jgi:hypothetical protein